MNTQNQLTQKQIQKKKLQEIRSYRSSLFFSLVRMIKYLLFAVVLIVWIAAFIILGALLLRIPTLFSKNKAYTFILIGLLPILILILYIFLQIKLYNRSFSLGLFRCR